MPKGWDRASLEINTRPVRVERDITRADLIVPRGGSLFALVLACLACGLGLSFLFIFWPLMLVAFLDVGIGAWILPAVFVAALAFAAALFVWEMQIRRDVLEEFRG
jgi:hypothetical protein